MTRGEDAPDGGTWHHGLVARWWAEFNQGGPEVGYFVNAARRFGGPVLDAGCGAGRLLLPLLRAGLDADGSDVSSDMLAHCRSRARREGLDPDLYRQANHELDLPRRYGTVVVCGAFGLGGSRERDLEALRRFHRHLAPGGALVMDHHLPYESADEWRYWLAEERLRLPEPWPEEGERRTAADGDELEIKTRLVAFDPLRQVARREIAVTLWRAGREVASERRVLLERLCLAGEVLAMLAQAGFGDVETLHAYTEEPAGPSSDVVVFVARR